MRRFLGGILGLLLFMACQDTPDGIIPQKQMANVLTDLHLIEGYLVSIPHDSMRQVARQYYQSLYDKYGTDSVGLYNSIEYYSNDPAVLNNMYKTVEYRLQKLEKEEQDKSEAIIRAQFVADSVRNAHVMDSIRRVTTDSARLKWSRTLLLADTVGKQADTVGKPADTTHATDSLALAQRRLQRAQRQDYLLQFLGNSRFELPFMSHDLPNGIMPVPPEIRRTPVIERDVKAVPMERAVPLELEDKAIVAPTLKPTRPLNNVRPGKRQ